MTITRQDTALPSVTAVFRTVRRLLRANDWNAVSLGAVAAKLRLTLADTVRALERDSHRLCIGRDSAEPNANWHVLEDGE